MADRTSQIEPAPPEGQRDLVERVVSECNIVSSTGDFVLRYAGVESVGVIQASKIEFDLREVRGRGQVKLKNTYWVEIAVFVPGEKHAWVLETEKTERKEAETLVGRLRRAWARVRKADSVKTTEESEDPSETDLVAEIDPWREIHSDLTTEADTIEALKRPSTSVLNRITSALWEKADFEGTFEVADLATVLSELFVSQGLTEEQIHRAVVVLQELGRFEVVYSEEDDFLGSTTLRLS